MKKDTYYYKFNEDDILEILTEYLAEKSNVKLFNAKAILLGKPGQDIRLVCAIANDIDGDSIPKVNNIDLLEIDKTMDFNGTHNQDGMTNEEFKDSINKALNSQDF